MMSTARITNALIPILRFPKFNGEGVETRLVDLCHRIGDGIHSTPVYSDIGEYHFINGNNLRDGVIEIGGTTKKLTSEEAKKHYRPLSENSILLSINGTIGNMAFYRHEKVVLGKSACYIDVKSDDASKDYIYNLLATNRVITYFSSELTGSTIKNLSLAAVKNLGIHLPSLPEQRKVACFLTAVDGRIGQLSQKKALLEDYKKGVMRQLFTQALRFKDDHGNEFPEWEEKRLGDVTKWSSGGTPAKDKPEYWDGDIPWMTAASMHGRYYDDSPLKITPMGLRNGSRMTQKGSILLLVRGSMLWNRIPVGIAIRDVAFNQDVKALVPSGEVLASFLLQWFIGSENKLLHTVVGTGIGAGKLDTDEMKSMELLLPSLPEQTKIADFLSALDRKIESVASQIRETQAFKKGLLQQMFV